MKITDPLDSFSIEQSFVAYVDKMYPNNPPSEYAIRELKLAYFTGAADYRITIGSIATELPPVWARNVRTKLDDELALFFEEQARLLEKKPETPPKT